MFQKTVIWAHRGASGKAPENTLAAFGLAELDGADGIELDVRMTADGVPVVMHDATLDRTTDDSGLLALRSLADLAGVDAGRWFGPQFAKESVPTLEQVLCQIQDRMLLNIEIKEFAAGVAVKRLLKRHARCRVLISSFDHAVLQALHLDAPELFLGYLSEDADWDRLIETAVANRAVSFHPRQDRVVAEQVELCHARGLKIFPWVVDEKKRAMTLLEMGVDGLFTNEPGSLRRWLAGVASSQGVPSR
ncbi:MULTISPECIES: glycerophosphodiester phosphodiesterase [Syntrophotalea]|jgi:glycerophosphoryl diester phosphodiesterase|uniref:GP-PDE domain-containing protein n=1 Tax=Syntrophotalea acetylenica TaxID=29542 RepID=A0A1L3GH45_SYNAC|nr:glycerophosphodiester phosphodiesterase family protein [Syntrophotalea acetylenica]APG25261.1 hypothetical protein A7E75_09735 [Syntrophotalea acetylenica]APG43330.1 hypothetical protein A6070_03735 [Syntrophotalea acetylenica]